MRCVHIDRFMQVTHRIRSSLRLMLSVSIEWMYGHEFEMSVSRIACNYIYIYIYTFVYIYMYIYIYDKVPVLEGRMSVDLEINVRLDGYTYGV